MADFQVTGVVDPARYSDRAAAVIEIDPAAYDRMSPADIDELRVRAAEEIGMRVVILVGARLARIEEPSDG